MIRKKETVVIAGCGEIGSALYQLCCGGFEQVIVEDPNFKEAAQLPQYTVSCLHISIPGSLSGFTRIVCEYMNKYDPSITMIHSTTPPGTTDILVQRWGEEKVVHTQVHGKHTGNRIRSDMLRYPRFVATQSDLAFSRAKDVLLNMGHPEKLILRLPNTKSGEMTKLLATSFYAYLIVWTQEIERLSKRMELRYEDLMSFLKLEANDFKIEGKYPGNIGGHCVMPNLEILQKHCPSKLWDYLLESNEEKGREDEGK